MIQAISQQLGLLLFTLIAQYIFNRFGFRAPFLLQAITDSSVALFCIILALFGVIKSEKATNSPEKKQ